MKRYEFTVATNNPGKLREFSELLGAAGHGCRSLAEAGATLDVEETGKSFEENASIKAEAVFAALKSAVLADDSGLCVDALGGAPGIYSARYAGAEQNAERNIDRLLSQLGELPYKERTARFVSVVSAILPNGQRLSATGICEGRIGFERRGEGGFGYDPVFYLPGNRSVAELSESKKNHVSHRARAVRKLCFKLRGITRIRENKA